MSKRIRRILVAIKDAKHPARAQIRKAATLARATGAAIELFHAISEPEVIDRARRGETERSIDEAMDAVAADTRRRLERVARLPVLKNLRVSVTPSWDYPPHEAIVRHVMKTNADLVVAAVQPHRLAGRLLLANTDWELIRHCPVPVLVVKSSGDYARPALIAAIDPFHAHAKPSRLDSRILDAAEGLSTALRGTLHVFHAYMPLAVTAPAPLGGAIAIQLPPEFEDMHTTQVETAFDREASRAGIPKARRHLHMGEVRGELAAVLRRVRGKIIVMGAVSRSALRRAFIGNTAEAVLDGLDCDVLVVKPAGFKTTVARRPFGHPGRR